MLDYLEEALDNARALLEQVKRLERGLSGAAAEETPPVSAAREKRVRAGEPQAGDSVPQEKESPDGGRDGLADEERKSRRQSETAPKKEDRGPEFPQKRPAPPEVEERENSVLLEELERLDRAVRPFPAAGYGGGGKRQTPFQPGEPVLPRSEAAFPETVDLAGENWGVGGLFPKSEARTEEALRWAERADQVFRRDSRRYDGGFYLY